MKRIGISKRRLVEEKFEELLEEFMTLYKRTYGISIKREEVIEILENRKPVTPITLKVAKLLEELFEAYHELHHHKRLDASKDKTHGDQIDDNNINTPK
ncbi:hypothetical protein EYM_00210 [Ignicoccus islandicus DSM 13165]|uniref:Uncharacterized protein n=1 Tax=Ignicoccus islandicus DSM 13165 TaxID=940295 RepID=A0A0U2U7L1_9CREN|nr:hypothetical protein [Ignicoccus islandicus]ALU12100.1 hypothetical protein EYM_00210 [Ignicoccus islandicus DSM 13165]